MALCFFKHWRRNINVSCISLCVCWDTMEQNICWQLCLHLSGKAQKHKLHFEPIINLGKDRYGHICKQLLKQCAWAQRFTAQRRGKKKQLELPMINLNYHQAHLQPKQSIPAPSLWPPTSTASRASRASSLHCSFCCYFGFNSIFLHVRRTAKHHLRQKNTSPNVRLIQSYCIVSTSTYINWLLKENVKLD